MPCNKPQGTSRVPDVSYKELVFLMFFSIHRDCLNILWHSWYKQKSSKKNLLAIYFFALVFFSTPGAVAKCSLPRWGKTQTSSLKFVNLSNLSASTVKLIPGEVSGRIHWQVQQQGMLLYYFLVHCFWVCIMHCTVCILCIISIALLVGVTE